jgi:hypothetical protein
LYFVEQLYVHNPTASNNAIILNAAIGWTNDTMYKGYSGVVTNGVREIVPMHDNGNLNYEWYWTYNQANLITGGILLHRYKVSTDLLQHHVVPTPPWFSGIYFPGSSGIVSSTQYIGPHGTMYFNMALSVRPILAQVQPLGKIMGSKIAAWSFYGRAINECNVKGRNYNAAVVTMMYFFNVTNPSAQTNGVLNVNFPPKAAGVKATEPGTYGFEVIMENGPTGFYEQGTIISSFSSETGLINHMGLVDHVWPTLQSAYRVWIFGMSATTFSTFNTTQYGTDAEVVNWGPRFGYPTCGF